MGERRDLTDRALISEMLRFWGPTTTARVLGWTTLAVLLLPGEPTRRDLLERGPGSQATRYRTVRELLSLSEYLRERGYELGEPDDDDGRVRALVGVVSQAHSG